MVAIQGGEAKRSDTETNTNMALLVKDPKIKVTKGSGGVRWNKFGAEVILYAVPDIRYNDLPQYQYRVKLTP
jgi:hypothetical protein